VLDSDTDMEDASDTTESEESDIANANVTKSMSEAHSDHMPAGPVAPRSFVQLYHDPNIYEVQRLQRQLKQNQCRRDGLDQSRRHIEQELAVAQIDCMSKEREVQSVIIDISATRRASGISDELWDEYESFCESLDLKFGSVDGWSISCAENHQGSYVRYDPDLILFKDHAEDTYLHDNSYGSCNFRCEASTTHSSDRMNPMDYVVEFWPVPYPEAGAEIVTWSEQYVSRLIL
jgi:hypothetical protein